MIDRGRKMAFGINTFKTKKFQHGFEAFPLVTKQTKIILKIVQLSNSKHDQFPKHFFTSNVV
jgi:hypothetical protein